MKKWYFDADYLQSCNCDYGCPCEFSAPPTTGACEGLCVWRIDKGEHGDVALNGLGLGLAVKWPGAIHEGNGSGLVFVDEKASSQQRDALLEIASGKAGGLPFEILATTMTTLHEPRFVPFDFHFDGLNSSVNVGDVLRIARTDPQSSHERTRAGESRHRLHFSESRMRLSQEGRGGHLGNAVFLSGQGRLHRADSLS